MTDAKQPAQFDWATELSDAEAHVSLSEQEAHEIGARLRSMGAKLKTYEDLGGAADDVQLLRMGYAAARLEIESLRKEHADELAVAYMCGASREKELAAQQGAAYAAQDSEHQMAIMEGERNASLDAYSRVVSITSAESRLYESAFTSGWDRRDRLASYGQASAQAAPASVLHLVHSAFAEIAMAFPKAFALHKVGIADKAVLEALAAPAQPDQPIACSYGDNGYACCEGGPCQADVHNDKLAEQQAPATAQAEESVPAPAPPPECETEAEKRAFAFGWFKALESERMKADSVQEDAALWRWLAEYLVGTRTDLDDEIVASETVNDLRKLVKAAIKQGEKQ